MRPDALLDSYLLEHTTSVDAQLEAIERWAHLHTAQPQMLCGPYEGRLLTMLCSSLQARLVVEIGSFVGYSTICLARGLAERGMVHAFEVNDELEDVIHKHLSLCGVDDSVLLHMGDALTLLPPLLASWPEGVDMAFVDAGKRQNRQFYDLLVPKMRPGGIVVVDNVLWDGKVFDEKKHHDADTLSMRAFNYYVQRDGRTENILLPVRDGIMLCVVK
ncbi:MAG: O-methyltransferase [Bacteroidales bacterium]|nr:O-methyltransferase [Bacteroidales bacterium]